MRKSFILHLDSLEVLGMLSDEQAGQMFKAIHYYQVNGQLPEVDNIISIAIHSIINQFKRDNEKYDNVCNRNKTNGLKGGRPSKSKTQENPVGLSGLNEKPKKPDSDSDNESDSKNDNDSKSISKNKSNNIEERKLKFATTLEPYLDTYGKELLNAFYKYWTEPNKSNTKYRQELQKTWDLSRRLETWSKNDTNFNKKPIKNGNESTISTIHAATTAKY